MLDQLLRITDKHVVLVLENADAVKNSDVMNGFLLHLRSLVEDHRDAWCRLHLVVSVAREPRELEHPEQSSFFDLADRIDLQEFDSDQIVELGTRYGMPLTKDLVRRLRDNIGGHPLLWSMVLRNMRSVCDPLDKLVAEGISVACRPYLERLATLVENQGLNDILQEIYQASLAARDWSPRGADVFEQLARLRKLGLVVLDGERRGTRPRNSLFRDYFLQKLGGSR